MCKAPYGHLMVNFSILIWLVVYPSEKYEFVSWDHYSQYPLVMTNIAMENGPFIDDKNDDLYLLEKMFSHSYVK